MAINGFIDSRLENLRMIFKSSYL